MLRPSADEDRTVDHRLGDYLARVRTQAGLSIRALARAMRVSPATVLEAERGRNPRASTLERYLEALPAVSAHALLQANSECAPAASPAAWEHYRELHGFSAERLELKVRVRADETQEHRLHVAGLRSHRVSLREDPRERTLLLSCVTLGRPPVLRSLRLLEEGPARGRHVVEDQGVRHEYSFASALDRVGIGYRRIEDSVSPAEASPMPWERGTRVDVRFPIESLLISVSFDEEPPAELSAAAWLRHQAVQPGDVDILAELHPEGLPPTWKRGRRRCVLRVEQPLVGTCYGLGWRFPTP